MNTLMPELLPCPFCGDDPYFEGDADDWKDDSRYVQMSLKCCTTMNEAMGWKDARCMTVEARTAELQIKLSDRWNTRAAIEASQLPSGLIEYLRSRAAAGELGYTTLSEWADQLTAIEAATEQGKRQPLRGEQIHAIFLKALPKQMLGMDYVPEWAIPVARAIEAAHGITATPQGKI